MLNARNPVTVTVTGFTVSRLLTVLAVSHLFRRMGTWRSRIDRAPVTQLSNSGERLFESPKCLHV